MNPNEKLQLETLKTALKQAIQSNPHLTIIQKQAACENIDRAAMQTDWIVDIARMCGWLK